MTTEARMSPYFLKAPSGSLNPGIYGQEVNKHRGVWFVPIRIPASLVASLCYFGSLGCVRTPSLGGPAAWGPLPANDEN